MPKRLAICVGINEYPNAPSATLQLARRDALAIASLLQDPTRGGFDAVTELLDDKAKKAEILRELETVLLDSTLTLDDLVLVYFSGHGALDNSDNLFLVPHDIKFQPDGLVRLTTIVHIKELEVLLDNTKAGYVVIILDACHSGASGKLLGRIKYRDSANIALIAAARYSEKAWEAPELEHSRFTECLLLALNERPRQGEWITLQQVLSFIQPRLTNLGKDQMMEVSSHIIDPNITLSRNPMYSLVSEKLTEEVKNLCKLAGYQILSTQPSQALPNLFIAREPLGFGRQSEMLVLCLDNSLVDVTDAHVAQFKTTFQSLQREGQVANGMIITLNDLPNVLKRKLMPYLLIEIRTKDELQRNLISFDHYLESLVDEFEKHDPDNRWLPPLKDCYIDLDAQLLSRATGRKPITEIVAAWLTADKRPAAIILGGYGTGKTTFSRKIAHDLAVAYLSSSDKRGLRVPILLYLRDFPRAEVDIEAFIIAHLKRRCKVVNPDFDAFRAMNDAGLFLLIFDGFDEMVVRADEDTIRRNLAAIEHFAADSNAKVLLTSRPEFFRSVREEQELFASSDTLARKRPRYEQVALLPLTPEQVDQYLQKRIPLIREEGETDKDWTYYRDEIDRIPGFQDLTKRPVLLEMIVKTLPGLIVQKESINRANLYDRYLRSEIDRQQVQKQRRLLIKRDDRFHLMQVIARCFYTENAPGLTAEQIQSLLQDEFSRPQREELDAHMRDFLSASFLIREADQYRFSHRSIMEYLAARDLADEIETKKPNIFRQYQLTPEVRDFLIDLKPAYDVPWRDTLSDWIHSTTGEAKETARYLGGNAITLLNFMKESFVGKDFRNTVLLGADLRRAQCKDACFRGSHLAGTDLSDCDLTNADLTDAISWEILHAVCPSCGQPIMPDEAFCDNCGAALTSLAPLPQTPSSPDSIICANCRTPCPSGAAFCDNCGATLPTHPSTSRSLPALPSTLIRIVGVKIGGAKGLDIPPSRPNIREKDLREWLLKNGAVEETQQAGQAVGEDRFETPGTPDITCPTCSTPNPYDAITCSTCGTSLSSKPEPVRYFCSLCQTPITSGTRFCAMCGALFSKVQCRSCSTLNPQEVLQCCRCNAALPLPQGIELPESPSRVADPSIPCPACGVLNSADSFFCKDCNLDLRGGEAAAGTLVCPECGFPVIPGEAFCDNCGAVLAYRAYQPPYAQETAPSSAGTITCSNCGTSNSIGATFCAACGQALSTTDTASPPPTESDDLSSGTLLANRYRIIQTYGRGGFNVAYLAEDMHLRRVCIVKQALANMGVETLAMRQQEVALLSSLNHTNLPKGYDVFTEAGKEYSVVEYIEGQTLQEMLDLAGKPLPELQVVTWARQICDLLEYLHTQQPPIIVRDIKPHNFVVRKGDNRAVLVDLAISRFYKAGKSRDTSLWGTLGYAPPEQYGSSQTDARSDIYGLGVTLHQLLTRHDPPTSPSQLPSVLAENRDLNPEWDRIIAKATQLERDNRYQSAAEMKAELVNMASLIGISHGAGDSNGVNVFNS